jgi:hypothetical protein
MRFRTRRPLMSSITSVTNPSHGIVNLKGTDPAVFCRCAPDRAA